MTTYISDQKQFSKFLASAQSSSVIAIDTEFMREKTYYPSLCLLQLATPNEVAIVDTHCVCNISALASIFKNPSITKVFHASEQDLEILFHHVGVMPHPIFDTQIAASVLGHTKQVGLGALVSEYCDVHLKKTDSYTNWHARPLTKSQINYAAGDVLYLPKIYEQMLSKLKSKNRLQWLEPEFKELENPARFSVDAKSRYKRLKKVGQLVPKQLAAAREVAAWRENEAQKRNIPRKWVLTDEQIVEICRRYARTIDELYIVRGVREKLCVEDARAVVKLMSAAFNSSPKTWPKPDHKPKNEENVDALVDALSAVIRLRAQQNNVAFQVLASHDDIVKIARGYRKNIATLQGWRKKLVGAELLEILDGKLAVVACGSGIKTVPYSSGEKANKQ